jgi:signal transduction histidine kinase
VAGQTGLIAVLRTTVDTAMELTRARYGALGVLGEHGQLVDFIHAGIDPALAHRIGRLPQGRGLLGTITRSGECIVLDDLTQHPDAVGFPDHHPPMTSFLGVPVRAGDNVFGNLYLTEKPEPFTEIDKELVEALAVIAGSAVSTARLHERLRGLALVEDRERIARELHDSVIQEIFAVGLSLQVAASQIETKPVDVSNRILDAVEQLDSSITTLRRYIFDIRERSIRPADLASELHELATQLAVPTEVDIRVSITGDAGRVPPDLVETALQFAREGVSNALRHSGAPAVDVLVTVGSGELLVEIRDGGRGFDPETVARGMGLDNLVARAVQAGGKAEIISAPDGGTVVRALLPLS